MKANHTLSSPVYILFLALVLLFLGAGFSQASGEKSDDQADRLMDTRIKEGIELMYNQEFDRSEELFMRMRKEYPERTAAYFYLAMVSWSRLSFGFWTQEVLDEYIRRIDRTIRVARDKLGLKKESGYDYLYLGGALGFKARFELMQRKWFSSFILAREAVEALEKCREMGRSGSDAKLGLGIFDYYTARLSGVLRFLSFLLLRPGDKELGLKELEEAAREAIYSRSEAGSILLHIYLFLEEDFHRALEHAGRLCERYSKNHRFHFLKATAFLRMGHLEGYHSVRKQMKEAAEREAGTPRALQWIRRRAYLETTRALYDRRYKEARAMLEKILDQPDPRNDPAMVAWPVLKIGMSYDLEGDRKRAREYYENVLDMENAAGSQFLASRLLNVPPLPSDPFIAF